MKTIEERIAELERSMFYLDMKDRWEQKDFIKCDEMRKELRELKKKLSEKN